jgi:hypothetical protein
VRVEYYRALAAAQYQPAISYYAAPYFFGADPPVILPVVYAPVIANPVYLPCSYGMVYSRGW